MPSIEPFSQAVSWPAEEGTLGVIGVAPWATLDFLRTLYGLIPAEKDWHYPRVLTDINTKLPSRGRYFELGERDPSPYIAQTIAELAQQGATTVVVPCNTAHLLYERWSLDAPVPVPSIVDAVVDGLRGLSPGARILVLASNAIREKGLYARAIEAAGYVVIGLSHTQQELVSKAIHEVKIGEVVSTATRCALDDMLASFEREDLGGVVLGCTELACLETLCAAHTSVVLESNLALARAALRAIHFRR